MMTRIVNRLVALLLLLCLIQPASVIFAYPEKLSDDGPSERFAAASATAYPPSSYVPYTQPASDSPSAPAEASADEASPSQPAEIAYVVSPGDTLYKIARDFNISASDLQTYNGITNPGKIQAGQKLIIPSLPVDVPKLDGKSPVIERVLSTTLTAYTSGYESTGKTPGHPAYGITYSGSKAEEGRTVAVDPSIIPLGSTVFIEGIGVRKAEDTGSAIKGSKIDVYMKDLDQAQNFGVKRNVKVFVLSAA